MEPTILINKISTLLMECSPAGNILNIVFSDLEIKLTVGENLLSNLPDKQRQQAKEFLHKVYAHHKPQGFSFPVTTNAGELLYGFAGTRAGDKIILTGVHDPSSVSRNKKEESLDVFPDFSSLLQKNLPPCIFWLSDKKGKLSFLSPAFLKFIGATETGNQPSEWSSIVHPCDHDKLSNLYHHNSTLEFRIKHASGNYRWVQSKQVQSTRGHNTVWAGVITDLEEALKSCWIQSETKAAQHEQGELLKAAQSSLFQEVQNRKVAERDLQDANAKLAKATSLTNSVLNHSRIIACSLNRDLIILEISKTAEETWGLDLQNLVGQHVDVLIHPADRRDAARAMHAAFKGEKTERFRSRNIINRGEVIEMLWSLVLSEDRQILTCLGSDITELMKKEAALQKRELQLQEAQVLAGVASYEVEIENMKWEVSPNMYTMFGWPLSEELTMERFQLDIVYQEDRQWVAEAFLNGIETKRCFSLDYRCRHRNGELLQIATVCRVERN